MEEHKSEQEPLTQQETNEKDSRFQISYHGKDISIKDLIGKYIGLPFKVLGLDYPEIEMSVGTELPAVEAKMYDVDNIFRLAAGSFLIVDYESSFKRVKTVKYINYATRLINWYDPDGKGITIRVLVIYTCDVLSAKPDYDAGGLKLSVDTFFMRDFPGEEKIAEIKEKIQNKERLINTDLMALVFAPLSVKGIKRKNEIASEIIDVAKSIKDEQADDVGFVLAHVAAMLGNIMTQEVKDKMWEALEMTWIDERYAEEKKKAVDEAIRELYEKCSLN